ncbi:hypothetical protein BB559_000474 [Furculomyces boomerangus]|uniref:DASH complex subunit DUO1 n=2 Tax=Harpellales TaxID=61421 RepID=A0A2T9Z551_9FUNG|nr:hypothetical protein BB559_004975 [Furculomyces boomerangus]PVU99727.1 hypothetical protein BB559_000474 [Furculomyces boomerangus]PWA03472.1 hypothetical protein BB558_000361 [Smittium angustum]
MDNHLTELENLRAVSKTFEEITDALESFKGQLQGFYENVDQTSQLLDMWSDIMAQSAFNYKIISEPDWLGGSNDEKILQEILLKEEQIKQKEEEERLLAIEMERQRIERLALETEERQRRSLAESKKPPNHPSLGQRGRGRVGTSGVGTRLYNSGRDKKTLQKKASSRSLH